MVGADEKSEAMRAPAHHFFHGAAVGRIGTVRVVRLLPIELIRLRKRDSSHKPGLVRRWQQVSHVSEC